MAETYTLNVPTLDRAPKYGNGGDLVPLMDCDPKGVAAKLTEEAAEAFVAWQTYNLLWREAYGVSEDERWEADEALADELADVIVAACSLERLCGLDLQAALDRCGERNRERGRIVT